MPPQSPIALFREQQVEGVVIGTMTGDEVSAVSVAEALGVPVLVFGTKEPPFTTDGSAIRFALRHARSLRLYRHKIPYQFAGIFFPRKRRF